MFAFSLKMMGGVSNTPLTIDFFIFLIYILFKEIVHMENKYLKLDWLGFTFKADSSKEGLPWAQFREMFPEFKDEYFVCPSFRTCYTDTMLYCDIVVSFNSFDGDLSNTEFDRLYSMGVNVQVSGHCLSFFFDMFDIDFDREDSFYQLLCLLKERNCKLSRVDLCYDDFSKIFDAQYYICKFNTLVDGLKEKRLIQTPSRVVTSFIDNHTGAGTIYFGSLKKRSKLLRIYDKYLESNGEVDSVRYEFEYHSDMAVFLGEKIMSEYKTGLPFLEMLISVVKVKDFNSLHNCSRIQDAKIDESWISALIGDLTLKLPIKISSSKRTEISNLNHYIENMAMSSIAGYAKCFGTHQLLALIRDALKHDRISPRYKSYYNKLKASHDLWEDNSYLDNPFI